MRRRRCFLLVEVLAGLALLATVGVWLATIQTAVARQIRNGQLRDRAVTLVEDLLGEWSRARVPVTLPATGQLADELSWQREVHAVRVHGTVLAPQVRLIVRREGLDHQSTELFRLAWLVAPPPESRDRK